jgi:hypothetical protein
MIHSGSIFFSRRFEKVTNRRVKVSLYRSHVRYAKAPTAMTSARAAA